MEIKEIITIVCGVYSLSFAVFHLLFWKIFNWKETLKTANVANRAIIQIANLRLIYIFMMVAFFYLFYYKELSSSHWGNIFFISNAIFWLGRTIEQFIFLKINHSMVHTLTVIFIIGFILFSLAAYI